MKHDKVMLIKKLEVADLQGEKVMIDFASGKYFLLKGIANEIWEELSQNELVKIEDIVNKIASEYEVAADDCRQDIQDFLEHLQSIGFIRIR